MNKSRNIGMVILLLIVVSYVAKSYSRSDPWQTEKTTQQVGIAEGQIAPAFKATDQFGHEQTNQTIAGKNGTVLLFFRSADW
jgi:cytochrome oxidase Cu insertion factor (SCO1/SenC/PrrC family)